MAIDQFTVAEDEANRRADVVAFMNGPPLAVLELKHPGTEGATLDGTYDQLQTYKDQVGSLFRTNAALVISNGVATRIDSLTADCERFVLWRIVAGVDLASKGTPELRTVLHGAFERRRLLDLLRDFIAFAETERGLAKLLAGYHQFHAVRRAVARTVEATTPAVFGDYINVYDIARAVKDEATVPIYHESRLARIELDEDEQPTLDAEVADLDTVHVMRIATGKIEEGREPENPASEPGGGRGKSLMPEAGESSGVTVGVAPGRPRPADVSVRRASTWSKRKSFRAKPNGFWSGLRPFASREPWLDIGTSRLTSLVGEALLHPPERRDGPGLLPGRETSRAAPEGASPLRAGLRATARSRPG